MREEGESDAIQLGREMAMSSILGEKRDAISEGRSGSTYIEGLGILEAVAAGQPAADKRLVGLAGTERRGGGGSRGRRRGCVVGRGAVGARRRGVRRSVGFALLGRHDRAFRRVLVLSSRGGRTVLKTKGLRRRVSRENHVIEVKGHVGCSGEEEVVRALGALGDFIANLDLWAPLFWLGRFWRGERSAL